MTLLLLVLLLLTGLSSVMAQDHRESVIIYGNVGPTIPIFDALDEYPVGIHGGGGIGIALTNNQPVSAELIIRLEVNQFPGSQEKAEDNSLIISIESKIRHQWSHWARPYFTLGFGTFFPKSSVFFGIGTDLDVDRSGLYFFYTELKYLHTDIDLIRLDVGIRFG